MDPLTRQPKAHHLAEILRERLRSQPDNLKLPSVRALMKRFRVSQYTVTSALAQLEQDHLIVRKGGSGTYANQDGRAISVCFCRPEDADYENDLREVALREAFKQKGWRTIVHRFNSHHVDLFADEIAANAFVVLGELVTFQSPLLNRLSSSGTPFVVLGRDTSGVGLDFVAGDDAPVIQEFVAGLVDRGHQQIAYLNSEPPFFEIQKRVECFQNTCELLRVRSHMILDVGAQYGTDSIARSAAFLRQYLADLGTKPLPFTALLTSSMSGSIPAPKVFNDAGFQIPRDFSLCCIGNNRLADYALPSLSNATDHYTELADATARIVEKRLEGNKSPILFERIPYRAIWRDSVSTPPRRNASRGRVKGVA